MGQEPGCSTQHEPFGHYGFYPLPASPFPEMREAIMREIEREQIRAQIIMSEIRKMRVLEEEAKPDVNIAGLKWNAVTTPVTDTSKRPSDSNLYKKAEGEWSCAVCQIIATSESALNKHLCEKKHKFKEASLKPQSPGKNSCIRKTADETILLKKTELLENPKPDNFIKDQAETIQSVKKDGDPKKTTCSFWCEMCQVGASSEIVMYDHENGKKHVKRLKERAQNGTTVPHNQKEKMEVPVNCVQHVSEGGKNLLSENVDDSTLDADSREDGETIAKREWRCALCQVIATSESALNEHLCEKKHKLNKASLKPQSPGKNSSTGKVEADTMLLKKTGLLENPKADTFENDEAKIIQSLKKNGDLKKTICSFSCEMCQVGTSSEIVMYDHENGKKHVKRMKEMLQNGEIGPCNKENCVKQVSEGGKNVLPYNVDVVSTEARLELYKPLNAYGNGFETLPIQIGTADLRVSEVRPVTENYKEEDKIILVANPDAKISGSKCKAVTPSKWKAVTPPVADTSKRPSDRILYKKAEVIATSESALNEHLCEKKHKFKETSLKPQSPRKNSSINTMRLEKTEMLKNQKSDNCKKVQAKTIQSGQTNGASKKTICCFWCERYQIGTSSDIVMNDHEKGKEHIKRLNARAQNDEIGPGNQKEKMELPVNCVHVSEGGESIFLEYVDVYDMGSHKLVSESMAEEDGRALEVTEHDETKAGGVDIIESGADSTVDAVSPEDGEIIVKGEWSCDLCQVISTTISALNEFLLGSKQKLKEASIEIPTPRSNSSVGKNAADTLLLKETILLENPKSDNFRKDKLKTIQSVQKNGDPKKTESFWHEKCLLGTSSEKVMNDHEKGRKHVKCVKETVQIGETCLCNKIIEEPLNCVEFVSENGESIFSHNVDVVLAEARLEHHKPVDASENGSETLPIQIRAADLRVSEVNPVTKNGKEEDKLSLVANPDADSSKRPSDVILYEKAEGERTCVATSESAPNEQLCEKKHKLDESSLKPQIPGKNSSIRKNSLDILLLKKTELLENPKSDFKKDVVKTIQSVQKNGDPKKTKESFWRKKCQVETLEKVVNDEEKRREHMEILQNGESVPCNQKLKIEIPVNCDNHTSKGGKITFSHNIDVVSAEARLELHKPLDASDNGIENLPIQIRAADSAVLDMPVTKNGKEEDKIILVANPDADSNKRLSDISYKKAEVEPSCVATSESALNECLCEKKHKLEEASLKTQSPGKNSTIGKNSRDTLQLKKTELLENPKSVNFKKDPSVQKNGDPKKTKDIFWRAKCRVGTSSDKVVIDEEKERKDVNHLKEIVQNSETRPCNQKEKIDVPVNCVEHISEGGKNILSHNVDVVLTEARSELHKPFDAYDGGFETLPVHIGNANLRVSEVKPMTRNGKEDEKIILAVNPDANRSGSKWKAVTPSNWKAVTPPVADTSKSTLNEHLCGKKYKMKEPSLKTELLENPKPENLKIDVTKTIRSVQKNGDQKAKESFWRKKCQVGTSSDKVNDEEKGRKRKEIVQNGETGLCNHKDKIEEPVTCVEHISEGGINIFSHILTKQDDTKAAGVNIIKPVDNSTLDAVSPKDGEIIAKGEWSCALCRVIATSESSLNEHFRGKKHKMKEASLKTQRPGNNSSVGNVAADTLLEYPKSDIKKDSAKTIQSVGKNGDLKKTEYSYWREICQVGPSEKVTNNLENRKESVQNDETGPCNQKEKMQVPVNCVELVSENGKNIFSEFFGVVSGQARLELHKPLDASDNGGQERVDKQNKKRWQIKIKD